MSPIRRWLECFHSESSIPVECQLIMIHQLSLVKKMRFKIGKFYAELGKLILLADHKQLGILCGVQGNSTSQRCVFCNARASVFGLSFWSGQPRTWDGIATSSISCAAEILRGEGTAAEIHLKYDNVCDLPFVKLGNLQWPLSDVHACPPPMHIIRMVLQVMLDFPST